MNSEDKAFLKAYAACVADAPAAVVEKFLIMDRAGVDHDEFYKAHPHHYSSIMDAWCMWQYAQAFANQKALEAL
jgi:hypothetical protein